LNLGIGAAEEIYSQLGIDSIAKSVIIERYAY